MSPVRRKSKLKECTSSTLEYKCVNSLVYIKQYPANQKNTAHSSLDRKCHRLTAVLEKYKKHGLLTHEHTEPNNKNEYGNTTQATR